MSSFSIVYEKTKNKKCFPRKMKDNSRVLPARDQRRLINNFPRTKPAVLKLWEPALFADNSRSSRIARDNGFIGDIKLSGPNYPWILFKTKPRRFPAHRWFSLFSNWILKDGISSYRAWCSFHYSALGFLRSSISRSLARRGKHLNINIRCACLVNRDVFQDAYQPLWWESRVLQSRV